MKERAAVKGGRQHACLAFDGCTPSQLQAPNAFQLLPRARGGLLTLCAHVTINLSAGQRLLYNFSRQQNGKRRTCEDAAAKRAVRAALFLFSSYI